MKAVCVIPARGGSVRIPRKNIRLFKGVPMVCHAINCAKASDLFERVIVSSEDDEVLEIAQSYGADVLVRPRWLAELDGNCDPGTQEIVRHSLEVIDWKGEFSCCLYPCTPLLSPFELTAAKEWLDHIKFDYAFIEGQFYYGRTLAFLEGRDLRHNSIEAHKEYLIDINTESDWQKAEELYEKLGR